jgi:hypothetical protein
LLACETAPRRRRPPTRNVVTRSLITICLARQGIIGDVGHHDPIPRKMPPPPEHTLLESSPAHSERTLWSERGLYLLKLEMLRLSIIWDRGSICVEKSINLILLE